jgi:GrpB-like predicted nucleotidyltransferase (UPF0157 family)
MSSDGGPEYLLPREPGESVVLAEPDPAWSEWYAVEEARIRAAVADRLVDVHHAGSTSVPGLAAKPIIDIVLQVLDSADEDSYVPALEAAGYRFHLREPHWHEHRLFKGGAPRVNLHVFSTGCSEADRMLLFRDWLRAHPADRDLYEQTKRDLASRRWDYVQDYADAKADVVGEIMRRALGQ